MYIYVYNHSPGITNHTHQLVDVMIEGSLEERARHTFEAVDSFCNKDGSVSREELRKVLRAEGLAANVLFRELDVNADGEVSYSEWKGWIEKMATKFGLSHATSYVEWIESALEEHSSPKGHHGNLQEARKKLPKKHVRFDPFFVPSRNAIEHTFRAVIYHNGWSRCYTASRNRPGQAGYQYYTSIAGEDPHSIDYEQPLRILMTGRQKIGRTTEERPYSYTGMFQLDHFLLRCSDHNETMVYRLQFATPQATSFIIYRTTEASQLARMRLVSESPSLNPTWMCNGCKVM